MTRASDAKQGYERGSTHSEAPRRATCPARHHFLAVTPPSRDNNNKGGPCAHGGASPLCEQARPMAASTAEVVALERHVLLTFLVSKLQVWTPAGAYRPHWSEGGWKKLAPGMLLRCRGVRAEVLSEDRPLGSAKKGLVGQQERVPVAAQMSGEAYLLTRGFGLART